MGIRKARMNSIVATQNVWYDLVFNQILKTEENMEGKWNY